MYFNIKKNKEKVKQAYINKLMGGKSDKLFLIKSQSAYIFQLTIFCAVMNFSF